METREEFFKCFWILWAMHWSSPTRMGVSPWTSRLLTIRAKSLWVGIALWSARGPKPWWTWTHKILMTTSRRIWRASKMKGRKNQTVSRMVIKDLCSYSLASLILELAFQKRGLRSYSWTSVSWTRIPRGMRPELDSGCLFVKILLSRWEVRLRRRAFLDKVHHSL